jgi:hypothetical protein|tara:strand:- start:66 stop:278 length:213 start_codon:yes stop_codon:yes gene_type:complete
MTTAEMAEDFKKQLEAVVEKIKELDTEINTKKEEYFKLLGAVQALELANKGVPDGDGVETPAEGVETPTE